MSRDPVLAPAGRLVDIISRNNLFLRGTDLVDEQRFVELFQEVWKSHWLGHRRALLAYFRDRQCLENWYTGGPSPAIFITANPPEYSKPVTVTRENGHIFISHGRSQYEREVVATRYLDEGLLVIIRDTKEPVPLGMFKTERGAFLFWAKAVNELPDEMLKILISHELCHAVFRSRGWFVDYFDKEGQYDMQGEEYDVREMNEELGYDEWALDEWLWEHPITPDDYSRRFVRTIPGLESIQPLEPNAWL
jgi:hypothetical protein